MTFYTKPESVVRQIWGDADVILLIFAGAAAEFALNRAVDWLFYTGKLPADPIARLISTVWHAQEIVFSSDEKARQVIGQMEAIHRGVEKKRGYRIPDWAYRDVLYMLIDYSERAFATLKRPLTDPERDELFTSLRDAGAAMGVRDLPANYADWQTDRQIHLNRDLVRSEFTDRLFQRYRDELGYWRYFLLLQVQGILVPRQVGQPLELPKNLLLSHSLGLYGFLKAIGLRWWVHRALLPAEYLDRIRSMDKVCP